MKRFFKTTIVMLLCLIVALFPSVEACAEGEAVSDEQYSDLFSAMLAVVIALAGTYGISQTTEAVEESAGSIMSDYAWWADAYVLTGGGGSSEPPSGGGNDWKAVVLGFFQQAFPVARTAVQLYLAQHVYTSLREYLAAEGMNITKDLVVGSEQYIKTMYGFDDITDDLSVGQQFPINPDAWDTFDAPSNCALDVSYWSTMETANTFSVGSSPADEFVSTSIGTNGNLSFNFNYEGTGETWAKFEFRGGNMEVLMKYGSVHTPVNMSPDTTHLLQLKQPYIGQRTYYTVPLNVMYLYLVDPIVDMYHPVEVYINDKQVTFMSSSVFIGGKLYSRLPADPWSVEQFLYKLFVDGYEGLTPDEYFVPNPNSYQNNDTGAIYTPEYDYSTDSNFPGNTTLNVPVDDTAQDIINNYYYNNPVANPQPDLITPSEPVTIPSNYSQINADLLPEITETPADPPEVDPDKIDLSEKSKNFNIPAMIKTRFPFCIPWDLKAAFSLLSAPAVDPVFEIPLKYEPFGIDYTFTIDLTEPESLQTAFEVWRWFIYIGFCICLIMATRSLIRG